MRYVALIDGKQSAYGVVVPDLPGCITTGATYEDVQKNIREAIALHLRGMVEDHEPIPVPQTTAEYADVSLPDSAA